MDASEPGSHSPTIGAGSTSADTVQMTSSSMERTAAEGSKDSESSSDSFLSSQRSPLLSPVQSHPMTSSLISTLDLGEDNRSTGSSGTNSNTSYAAGEAAPMTPSHLLGQPTSLARAPLPTEQESLVAPGADDSALEALMEAHEAPSGSSKVGESPRTPFSKRGNSTIPHTRDASFGLDPDADTTHSIEGTPLRIAPSSSHHRPTSNHRSIYNSAEELSAPSHTTAATGAPKTMKTNMSHTQTVPTASATGMPRFLPRRTSRSPSSSSASSSYRSSQPHAPDEMMPQYPPSGSLTLAIFSKNITWQRRGYLLLASIAINLGLPFINGVMLGFGEIFARSIVAPYIGLAPAAININAPGPRAAAGTSGAGLRYAGVGESRGAGGSVSIESWEVEPGQRGRPRR